MSAPEDVGKDNLEANRCRRSDHAGFGKRTTSEDSGYNLYPRVLVSGIVLIFTTYIAKQVLLTLNNFQPFGASKDTKEL